MYGAVTDDDCANSGNIGIYIIVSSSLRFYVGQSSNLKKRKYEHIRTLRKGTHTNKILQDSFNKYGYLTYKVVEYIDDPALLTEREQHWMDKFQAYGRGMNLTPAAASSLGCTRTEEQRELISQITTEFWGKEENRKAQSERKKAFFAKNPQHLDLMSAITKRRLEDSPELRQQHSEMMKEISNTPEAIEKFNSRMAAWRATLPPDHLSELAKKSQATKEALGEEYAYRCYIKGRRTWIQNLSDDSLILFSKGFSKNGTPRLDVCVRWTELDKSSSMKRFSVFKYGLIPAYAKAKAFRDSVVKRLISELEEIENRT